MSKSIPKGYQIRIRSWENDADHYNTETKSGLSKEAAKFYIEFASLFTSRHDREKPGFGNVVNDNRDRVDWDELSDAFKAIVEKYPTALKEIGWKPKDLNFDDQDNISDAISELHYDLFGGSEMFMFRVYDGHEAYYFPEAVKSVKL